MQVDELLLIAEVENGPAAAGELFQRRFGQPLVRFGHHHVGFYRQAAGRFATLGYLHVTDCGDIGLVGGGCTDNELMAQMPAAHQAAFRTAGGVLLQMLRFAFRRHHDDFEALFGVCGHPRAFAVDMQAGFVPTAVPQLLVYCPRAVAPARLELLTEKAQSFMPF